MSVRHRASSSNSAARSAGLAACWAARWAGDQAADRPVGVTGTGLAIVWHSRTGAANAMAGAIYDGAGAEARRIPAESVTPDMLLAAAGFVFVCPENLASMTGAMKEMFDRCYYPLLGQVEGRAYATAIAAGSDGHGAQGQIDRIARGWRLRRVAEPLIVNLNAQTPEAILAAKQVPEDALARCRDLGMALGEGLRMGLF